MQSLGFMENKSCMWSSVTFKYIVKIEHRGLNTKVPISLHSTNSKEALDSKVFNIH